MFIWGWDLSEGDLLLGWVAFSVCELHIIKSFSNKSSEAPVANSDVVLASDQTDESESMTMFLHAFKPKLDKHYGLPLQRHQ